MSPQSGSGSSLTASELNNKFQTDYNDCIEMLEREKLHHISVDDDDDDQMISITDDELSESITAEKQQKQKKKKLLHSNMHNSMHNSMHNTYRTRSRTHSSSRSQSTSRTLTTTQKMLMASSENVIIPPWSTTSVKTRPLPHYFVDSSTSGGNDDGEQSTSPTFLSVGEWQNDLETIASTTFLVSKDSVEATPLLQCVSMIEAKSKSSSSSPSSSSQELDRETRKRLYYKEKLRVLTDRLTTHSAVERSRDMLANITERRCGNSGNNTPSSPGIVSKEEEVLSNNHQHHHQHNPHNHHNHHPHDGHGQHQHHQHHDNEETNSIYKKMIEGARKKLYACSMKLCYEEAIADHEGLVISVPAKKNHSFVRRSRLYSNDCEDDHNDDDNTQYDSNDSRYTYDGDGSDISSLTGATRYHFQSRYWTKYNGEGDVWI